MDVNSLIRAVSSYISELSLAKFLRELMNEEERLKRSVPCIDTLKMLNNYCEGTPSETTLRNLVKRLLEAKLLRSDKKELRLHTVGYFVETGGVKFFQERLKMCPKEAEKILTIDEILEIARQEKSELGKRSRKKSADVKAKAKTPRPPSPEELHQRNVEERCKLVCAARSSLEDVKVRINDLEKNLARRIANKRTDALTLQKIQMQIAILRRREKEEIEWLKEAEEHYCEVKEAF